MKTSTNHNNKIVIIDEAGYLELENQGWASSIRDLLNASNNHILLVVRNIYVEKIIQKWNLKQTFIYDISEDDYLTISNSIIEHIR